MRTSTHVAESASETFIVYFFASLRKQPSQSKSGANQCFAYFISIEPLHIFK